MKDKIIVIKYAPGSKVRHIEGDIEAVIDQVMICRESFVYSIVWWIDGVKYEDEVYENQLEPIDVSKIRIVQGD